MIVQPYRPGDDDALYDVCLRTGDSGEDASGKYADPRLLGELFVGPYLRFEPELAFVVDDGAAAGYVLGARDTYGFEETCEQQWWPALRERYPLDAFPEGSADAELVNSIHHRGRPAADVVAAYPSHLHIDLLPRVQGQGMGRAMMRRQLAALHEAGSPAVHLGVGSQNARAIAFYERMGFSVLKRKTYELIMGRPTAP